MGYRPWKWGRVERADKGCVAKAILDAAGVMTD
jgi:hypothetical protein